MRQQPMPAMRHLATRNLSMRGTARVAGEVVEAEDAVAEGGVVLTREVSAPRVKRRDRRRAGERRAAESGRKLSLRMI